MHELPQNLTNSLQRFSSRTGAQHGVEDIEKGLEDLGTKKFDQEMDKTQSSLILVCISAECWTCEVQLSFCYSTAPDKVDERNGGCEPRASYSGQ